MQKLAEPLISLLSPREIALLHVCHQLIVVAR